MFYTYTQNNSGGSFDYDRDRGISNYVIVEADNKDEANLRAEQIGLYFDGCDTGMDCDCCGDRWGRAYYTEGTEGAEIYGESVLTFKPSINWQPEGFPHTFVHFKDGGMAAIGA